MQLYFNLVNFVCLSQARTQISIGKYGIFLFVDFTKAIVVHVANIGRFIDHHCLIFVFFIVIWRLHFIQINLPASIELKALEIKIYHMQPFCSISFWSGLRNIKTSLIACKWGHFYMKCLTTIYWKPYMQKYLFKFHSDHKNWYLLLTCT